MSRPSCAGNSKNSLQRPLFDRHALRKIAGLVDIATEFHRYVVGQQLQWNDAENRRQIVRSVGYQNHIVADFFQGGVALRSNRDDRTFAGFDLLDVADVFLEDGILGSNEQRGCLLGDECDHTMLKFGTGIARGGDVADFLQLQRPLESNRIVRLAAHKEEVVRLSVFFGDSDDLRLQLKRARHKVGQFFHLSDHIASLTVREMANAAQKKTKERENRQLRGKGLRCGDADLRSRVHVDAAIAFTGDRAGDIIADAKRAMPFALALTQGGKSVGRLPALADDKSKSVALERDIAVAELAGELTLYGNV